VYRRFRDHGRLAPEGLRYVSSWVTEDLHRCFQVMECDDRSRLAQWTARWEHLIEFEVIPVVTSARRRPRPLGECEGGMPRSSAAARDQVAASPPYGIARRSFSPAIASQS